MGFQHQRDQQIRVFEEPEETLGLEEFCLASPPVMRTPGVCGRFAALICAVRCGGEMTPLTISVAAFSQADNSLTRR